MQVNNTRNVRPGNASPATRRASGEVMNSDFEDFVASKIPPHPNVLPLVHVTQSFSVKDILKSRAIRAIHCKVFSEDLAYFFYGVARYRSSATAANKIRAWLPSAFIIRLDPKKADIRRVFPFDSGAFKGDRFSSFFHPDMKIDDFLLPGGELAAQKCVQTFYASNKSYQSESPIKDLSYPQANFHVDSYKELISSGSTDAIDHRRSAIEFQIGDDVNLGDHEVIAVIIPESLMDDKEWVKLIRTACQVEPLPYFVSKTPSDFQHGGLSQVVNEIVAKHL